jgi:hypothetical protein
MDNWGAAVFIGAGVIAGGVYKGQGSPRYVAEKILCTGAQPLEQAIARSNLNPLTKYFTTSALYYGPRAGAVLTGMTIGACAGSMAWEFGATSIINRATGKVK